MCIVCSSWVALARADQLVVQGENLSRVRITGLVAGMLQFEDAERGPRAVLLGKVDLLLVESVRGLADLSEAERYLAEGDFERAIVRYQRALRVAEGFWTDLVQTRLLRACDEAGHSDQALLSFVRVMRGETTGLAAAADMIPRHLPTARDAALTRGLKHLESALGGANDEQRALLELVRYEVLRRAGDDRAAALAPIVAERRLPELLRNERTYEIQLAALRELLQGAYTPGQMRALDQALADCPEAVLPSFLLLKGEVLLRSASSREECIRAAWPFMRVVIHMPGDPRAAEGLYGAAQALERIGRAAKAVQLLEECVAHAQVSAELRGKAERELERLKKRS